MKYTIKKEDNFFPQKDNFPKDAGKLTDADQKTVDQIKSSGLFLTKEDSKSKKIFFSNNRCVTCYVTKKI